MKNIKMIVTDLDNTLLRSDKSISEYTVSVFNKCRKAGLLTVFATARPERTTKKWQNDCTVSYVIANNGATITKDGEEIYNLIIPDEIKNRLLNRLTGDVNIINICAETGTFLYNNDANHNKWGVIFPLDTGWNSIFNDFSSPIAEDVCKFAVECKNPNVIKSIMADFPDLSYCSNSNEDWHLITHKSATKLNAVKYISDLTDIPLECIITFGDDYNDLEMLEKCGTGVAAGNAADEIKCAADYICGTNNDDGVAAYLEKHLLCD